MASRRALVIVLAALFALPFVSAGGVRAQTPDRPIAGSGDLPAIDPFAQAPANVVEAVAALLSNRTERNPFNHIKSCFGRAGSSEISQFECRRQLDRYFREVKESKRDLLGKLPPLEVYARLVALSQDAEGVAFSRDVYALRGILTTVDDARRFREVKKCFSDAGPQPAIRQICRQRLDRFYTELAAAHPSEYRDLDPKQIRSRLFQVADRENSVFGIGETTAFDSLREIRKAQQDERQAAVRAMAEAQRRYCKPSARRQTAGLEQKMASDGVCLCAYGGRYLGSNPGQRGRPVQAGYPDCGGVGRFRIRDLDRGYLMHGDWITLQAAHGGYVSVHRNGYVYADRAEAGTYEKFRLVRASGRPGRIRPGEMVTLISPRGVFVSIDLAGGGLLRGTRETPKPHDYFVFVR